MFGPPGSKRQFGEYRLIELDEVRTFTAQVAEFAAKYLTTSSARSSFVG